MQDARPRASRWGPALSEQRAVVQLEAGSKLRGKGSFHRLQPHRNVLWMGFRTAPLGRVHPSEPSGAERSCREGGPSHQSFVSERPHRRSGSIHHACRSFKVRLCCVESKHANSSEHQGSGGGKEALMQLAR